MKGYIDFLSRYQKVPVKHYPSQVPENPWVSICVQTYQHAQFLRECLDGILMQETDFDYEILLGEDASTDGTREICIEYTEKYPDKIRLFLHSRENNIKIDGKPTGRFNFMYNLYQARGKYITLCEGDDYWTDSLKLQYQVAFLESDSNYVMCFTSCMVINGMGKRIKTDKIDEKGRKDFDQIDMLKAFGPTTQTVMFRSDTMPSVFPKRLLKVPNPDTYLFYIILKKGRAGYLPYSTAAYRIHEGGIWGGQDDVEKIRRKIRTYSAILAEKDNNQILLQAKIDDMYRRIMASMLDKRNLPMAFRDLITYLCWSLSCGNFRHLKFLYRFWKIVAISVFTRKIIGPRI